ncbi:recombinase family protein [Pseudoclavibacter terrae]|uniref:Recombinase family protein n=1 Tax=Pseudoclavibacter terrae TaxID=1530195 RepID=A0A7J5B6E9_9MICO|nr:recombinase family protein [Pseudoclavibacter terrae]KAB1639707.1 hypothetical protein F8O03_05140 [Pseudoclavibacter terrae]
MAVQEQPRAALYARISEDDNSVDKTGNQLAACLKLAEKANYKVVAELDEGTVSAYQGLERPRFKELAQLVQSGAVDVVVATEQTRLAREDHERAAFAKISADRGVLWHFSTSGAVLDLSKPTDRLNAGITGLFASYESDLKKMRLNARFDAQRILGLPLWGPRPFGYEKDRVTIRESEAEHLREAYAAVIRGETLNSIVRDWEKKGIRSPVAEDRNPKRPVKRRGGNTYNVTMLKALLLRERNIGVRTSGAGASLVREKGAWPEIVQGKVYLEARDTLRGIQQKHPGQFGGGVKKYLSAGLVLCACGLPLRSGSSNGTMYLRCRPSYERRAGASHGDQHSSVRMDIVEPYVRGALIRAICEAPLPDDQATSTGRAAEIEAEMNRARGSIERLLDVLEEATEGVPQIQARIAKQERALSKLAEERGGLALESRGQLSDLRADMFSRDPETGKITASLDAGVTLRRAVGARLDAMTIAEQTLYAREYVRVRVAPGRRAAVDRLSVSFLKSPHLDPEIDDAQELASWNE